MLSKYHKLILLLIILVAGFLRFYNIGSNPPSMSWDELALGYNAYSLGIDGKDEFGVFLPYKYLESFGDFKPPLYSYADIIPIKIFGLTEFAVRFPSALFGTLSVLLTYFLAKQIFYAKKKKLMFDIEAFALISALVLAISPWHIMLSRAAFEANIATFLIIAGTLFYLLGINKKSYNFILSAIFFALTFYTFNSSRVFVPLFVISISILSYKDLIKKKKAIILSALVGFIIIFPLISFLRSPQAELRFKEVNIFSDLSIVENANKKIAENNNSIFAKVIYNRRVGYAKSFAKHYFDHFNPEYLFITGDNNPRFSVRKVGQLYIWDALFLILGIIALFKFRVGKWYFIPIWIVLGIIPAATARETPHALRTETIIPTLQMLIAFGFMSIYAYLKSKTKFSNIIALFLFALLILNAIYFIKILFKDYPKEYAGEWQYGYKEIAKYAGSQKNNYSKIYIDEEIGRPYIYYVFYNKISPSEFMKKAQIQRDIFGFVNITKFENINFSRSLMSEYEKEPDNLYIQSFNDPKKIKDGIPKDAKILKIVKELNGKVRFIVYSSSK